MAEFSKIEWCDHTFNPWIGCQKVSPGCDNCYAEALMDKRLGRVEWGPHGERKRTSVSNWREPKRWNADAETRGIRYRVFCASLADVFDNKAPAAWRRDLFELIAQTPRLDWLLLTKRPENMRRMLPWGAEPWPNVWLGITAEDNEHFARRWPHLEETAAQVRFISYEPALGPLRFVNGPLVGGKAPDWLICGGESGPNRRQMDLQWARDIRDDCRQIGTRFFMKQIDKVLPIPADLMVRESPL